MDAHNGECLLAVPNGQLDVAAKALRGRFKSKQHKTFEIDSEIIGTVKDGLKQTVVWDERQTFGDKAVFFP
jgi:hypothetical protein